MPKDSWPAFAVNTCPHCGTRFQIPGGLDGWWTGDGVAEGRCPSCLGAVRISRTGPAVPAKPPADGRARK